MPRTNRNRHLTAEVKKIRRRVQKKLSMRRARAKLTEAAVEEIRKKDRERYHMKKDRGEIKTIDDYTPRKQREIRKMWREKSKKRRQLLKMRKATSALIQENTPPPSPSSSFSRIEVGRAVAARNKREKKIENETLKKKVLHMAKQIKKYRMRIRRLEERKQKASNVASPKNKALRTNVRKAVYDFLIQDEYSRLTSEKNETITRKKSKRQIRLLNDTLLNLHVIFQSKTGIKISYQTFRRYRPFWVLFPKTSARNTCLCTLHENNDQIIRSLQKAKVVSYRSASDAVKVLCCNNTLNPKCLERECQSCRNKKLVINNFNENDYITYDRWVTKNVDVIVKGEHKKYKKCLKETVKTMKGSLVKLLHSNLPLFMQHVANMIHQIRSIQTVIVKLVSRNFCICSGVYITQILERVSTISFWPIQKCFDILTLLFNIILIPSNTLIFVINKNKFLFKKKGFDFIKKRCVRDSHTIEVKLQRGETDIYFFFLSSRFLKLRGVYGGVKIYFWPRTHRFRDISI
ncbi:uncharacterized protein LOC125058196 [Pieris napi]|uniref:uncharacterized protein LOC125058196 n=1 Tax=Pieris napi TaxID=78633 RepID=UPI001FB89720|nr:uncharacterized protein LOC125058196 [Pieris napi]